MTVRQFASSSYLPPVACRLRSLRPLAQIEFLGDQSVAAHILEEHLAQAYDSKVSTRTWYWGVTHSKVHSPQSWCMKADIQMVRPWVLETIRGTYAFRITLRVKSRGNA